MRCLLCNRGSINEVFAQCQVVHGGALLQDAVAESGTGFLSALPGKQKRESITDIAGEGVRQIQVEGEKPRQADFEHRTSIRQVATSLVSVKLNCMDRFWLVE